MAERKDNFGALRLAAATAVLVSHAFRLTGRSDPAVLFSDETLGDIAVAVFFAISGFLVAGSWCRDPSLARFLARRVRRIWPGLIVAVLVGAYVVGPLFSKLAPADYLGSGATRTYVIAKVTMLGGGGELPGVFAGNPHPEVNGSLWTLPIEVKAYLLLAAISLAGAFRRRGFLLAAWALALVTTVLVRALDGASPLSFAAVVRATGIASPSSLAPRALYLVAVFLGGALLYSVGSRLRLRGLVAAVLLAAWLLSKGTVVQWAIGAAAFPYACLWAAYRTRPVFVRFFRRTDLSFGIYLYSYPVEQAIRALAGPGVTPPAVIAIALPVTGALALLSWRVVEKPWLARRTSRSPARAVAAS